MKVPEMKFVRLGRTGEMVSVAGLGCGGHSQLGLRQGRSMDEAADIVRAALDMGITFIDTATAYGTEEVVGRGIAGRDRDTIFISTKSVVYPGWPVASETPLTVEQFVANLDASLANLGTDHVDLWNLHGVMPEQLPYTREVLLPEMLRQREKGKVRFLGLTEAFLNDKTHAMLQQALPEGEFDVAMIGFNLLNPGARRTVFPLTRKHDVGTLIMFAVRRALNSRENAAEAVAELVERGEIDPGTVDRANPLGFLGETPGIGSQVEAAYRFCRHEPGAHVVLTGTGKREHLEKNVAAILAPKLPDDVLQRLESIFGHVTSISGN